MAFKGSFNIRLSPELHKKLFIYTTAHQMSINKYIENTLENSPAAHVIV
ncbi:toxin-antitoxin system HicB family antitoxin [Clostridium sp. OF09-36]